MSMEIPLARDKVAIVDDEDYGPLAAVRLVQLTKSTKEEIARKACLDIISIPKGIHPSPAQRAAALSDGSPVLSDKAASAILQALADGAASQGEASPGEPSRDERDSRALCSKR